MSELSNKDAQLEEFAAAQLSPEVESAVKVQLDKLEGRARQLSARIRIPYSQEQVWQVLTDYDALADFIPNLAKCRQLPHPQGGVRLEQVGVQQVLFLDFSARVVLDMAEHFPQELRFSMVEGDFKVFSGSWRLEPWQDAGGSGTHLIYTVEICPKRTMPVIAVERRISSDLPLNLLAILQRSHKLFGPQAVSPEL